MRIKTFLSFLFSIIVIVLLILYWFIPFGEIRFTTKEVDYNFNLNESKTNLQFYQNMRFPESDISYKIYDECTLKKKNDMNLAFDILQNKTILEFYPVESSEDISVYCEDKIKIDNGMFIAGEGGPSKTMINGERFNVIFKGEILLIRDSKCSNPNVALHELLHALGFNHSNNKDNIMYPVSKCNQEIGDDMINLLNKLYSVDSFPDLSFENVSAKIQGRYLDTNISIKNLGLKESKVTKIYIYSGKNKIKEIKLNEVGVGEGRSLFLQNIFTNKLSISELKFEISYNSDELDKSNNIISLFLD